MRYRTALLLSLLCGSVRGQTSAETPLTVMLEGGADVPAAVLATMEREAESAMARSGTALAWEAKENVSPAAAYDRLAMIRLKGRCTPDAILFGPLRAGQTEALGQTQVVDGNVLPIADIRCDAVHRLIERELRAAPRKEQADLLGRALGRVIAHELYHIMLRTMDHGNSGLSRAVQTSSDLLAAHDSFTREEADRIASSGEAGR